MQRGVFSIIGSIAKLFPIFGITDQELETVIKVTAVNKNQTQQSCGSRSIHASIFYAPFNMTATSEHLVDIMDLP